MERKKSMKILIVDDEPLIQIKLEDLLKKNLNGNYKVFSTSDSYEALEILKEQKPQILLTDIRMPRITGVDLAKYVFESQMHTAVLFITGYSDFEYAKSGIDYHVFDYLLKPIEDEKAIRSVKKAISYVSEYQKHEEMYSLFQNYFSNHFEMARKQFIEKLLFLPLTESKEQFNNIQRQFNMMAESYCLCAITFSFHSKMIEEGFYYSYIIEQYLNRNFQDIIIYPFGNIVYVLWLDKKKQRNQSPDVGYEKYNKIKNTIESTYPVELFIGVSRDTEDLYQIQMLRKQVIQCLEYAQIQNKDTIVFFSDLSDSLQSNDYFEIADSATSLIRVMRLGEMTSVKIEIDNILNIFRNKSEEYILGAIELLISNILLFVQKLPIPSVEIEKIQNNILGAIHQQSKLALKIQYFQYWIEYIVNCIKDAQFAEQSHLMQQVYDYINFHYKDAIGLTSLAEYVNKNPSYLSRFIKQQTNKNFSQILTERRIDEAKSLLRTTNLKISQIAEKTGYPNVKYFTRVFNTQVSMSPADYRKITTAFCSENEYNR